MRSFSKKIVIKTTKALIADKLDALASKLESESNRIYSKYKKEVTFNLELIIEDAVTAFYDSYSPHVYSRQESMLKAYKITIDKWNWSFETGPQYMKGSHRISNDYIYMNSFEEGYHGGARDGEDHPQPGVPYWKAPPGGYYFWGSPATQGPPPDSRIQSEANEYMNKKFDEFENEYNTMLDEIRDEVVEAANLFRVVFM